MLRVGNNEEELNASYYRKPTKCKHTVTKDCEITGTHAKSGIRINGYTIPSNPY